MDRYQWRKKMSQSITWNLWHGCQRKSEGCLNCYMYSMDARHGKNSSIVEKTNSFNLPIQKNRQKEYKIKSGTLIYTCFTSDFFVVAADAWRADAWRIIKERADCEFLFLTKRPERFYEALPKDWNDGYENVTIGVSCENQKRANERLSILLELPIKHKIISIAPMLEYMEIEPYLSNKIELVICDGESGLEARPICYDWVLSVREQCIKKEVDFVFRQTGANFIKDGKRYHIPKAEQMKQAKKANINYVRNNKWLV